MAAVQTMPGLGGLPKVVLRHRAGSSAEVYLFGGTLTSFRTPEKEMLFVSKQAVFDGKKALRGGVPIVFPQFGQPDKSLPSHGFARTSAWTLADSSTDDNNDTVKATLTLSSSEDTLKLWPFPFLLSLSILLRPRSLSTSLRITNTGSSPFPFQALLHTYFAVNAIQQVSVRGLQSIKYHDKLLDPELERNEDRADVTLAQEVDRIYKAGGPKEVTLLEGGQEKMKLQLSAQRFTENAAEQLPVDMVLWNPWIDKTKGLTDMADEEYLNMVCLEPGLVSDYTTLQPGQSATLEQTITEL